jgi:hypothetical protein
MKKFILAVVFVFATATTMNANTLMTEPKSCSEIAFDLQGDLEDQGVGTETANEVASLIYEICEAGIE